ncbi:MAG: hypothetical protein AAF846_09730 [Chloroflexota bacterium]
MTVFAMGFIFIMIFTLLIGIGAVIFLSFDATASENLPKTVHKTTQQLYAVVRQVNTNTIETVDGQGTIQRWERSA